MGERDLTSMVVEGGNHNVEILMDNVTKTVVGSMEPQDFFQSDMDTHILNGFGFFL